MFGNKWLEDIVAPAFEHRQRACLILFHEPAVSDDVGRQNGSEAALRTFFSHTAA